MSSQRSHFFRPVQCVFGAIPAVSLRIVRHAKRIHRSPSDSKELCPLMNKPAPARLSRCRNRGCLSCERQPDNTSGRGGIGRRAGFRCQWGQPRGGSSPLGRIQHFVLLPIHLIPFAPISDLHVDRPKFASRPRPLTTNTSRKRPKQESRTPLWPPLGYPVGRVAWVNLLTRVPRATALEQCSQSAMLYPTHDDESDRHGLTLSNKRASHAIRSTAASCPTVRTRSRLYSFFVRSTHRIFNPASSSRTGL